MVKGGVIISSQRKKGKKKNVRIREEQGTAQRKIWAVVLVLFSIYAAYAFSTANPTIIDQWIGKYFITFLFGNTTFFWAIYGIVSGVMIYGDHWRPKSQIMLLIALILFEIMIFLSLNIAQLTTYSIADLFPLSVYGGYGGIFGTFFAFLLLTILRIKIIPQILMIVLILIELFLVFKYCFPSGYEKVKEQKYGKDLLMKQVGKIQESKEIYDKRKEEQKKRDFEEKELTDQNFDDLFHSPSGELSVDTQYLDIHDIMDQIDEVSYGKEASFNEDSIPLIDLDRAESALKDSAGVKVNTEMDMLEEIDHACEEENEVYVFPDEALLNPAVKKSGNMKEEVRYKASQIEKTLKDFGVDAKIVGVDVGPSITRFELQPSPGVKVSKIVGLCDDLALNLATSGIRMEAPIPGKAAVGIEVPNEESEIVCLKSIIESPAFQRTKAVLPVALGKTLSGQNIIGDISKMPHVLIAGATGSGKSVCINTIIISLLYKKTPDELKFIMIDPKMVELNQYNNIPHQLIPVVTDPKKAAFALNWGIKEMTNRYNLFKDAGVRDIDGFNTKMVENGKKALPRIVIIIDELADLMMTSPKEVENAICRIAQLARACGIHLVIATQRPSVDVITGLIKANIPSRIAFAVASNTDSRTILDMAGAEKLLGKGDMLYFPVGKSKPLRVQCTYVSDDEINRVIGAIEGGSKITFDPQIEKVIEQYETLSEQNQTDETEDALFPQAVEIAFTYNQISTSMIQRKLKVGYARAGRIVDELEQKGIISGPNGSKPRELLMSREVYYSQEKNHG